MRATRAAILLASHLLFELVCIDASRSTDCISHMDACVSPHVCKSQQSALRQTCHYKDGVCRMTDAEQCTGSLQMMLAGSPVLQGCVCSLTDPCRTLQQLYSHCQPHWVLHADRPCLTEIAACLGDESCNRPMVPLLQECKASSCNRCTEAIRQFYSALPHSVAETLVFCECGGQDQQCQEMKALIHYGSCVGEQTQTPWTCLEALDSCFEDPSCRQVFSGFLSKCFEAEESAFDSTSDWLYLLDPDFFLGEEVECRAAFVKTVGSVLHHPCTCAGLHHHHQYKCDELKLIFQDKSLFKRSRTKDNSPHGKSHQSNTQQQPSIEPSRDLQWIAGENLIHGQSNDSSIGQQPTNESQVQQKLLSDQLLYLLIYISALMVVVLFIVSLVLHRVRRIHQAAGKPTFEEQQSKSLMLSSVII
ncbi:GDNF family receptor alpha-like [Danio aesculapii]|uniref:GDNF family receptor alpha-like n=1 Tax=Danio aesculapii TaxID=1142201 RepID=UPI0024C097AD|nr:GDNF family receptor alpha-like [Danio aesculapii]